MPKNTSFFTGSWLYDTVMRHINPRLVSDKIGAITKEEQKEQDEMQGKVKDLESKVASISFDKSADSKLMEMQSKIERKMKSLQEAMQSDNKTLFKRREKVLEKLVKEVENLG